MPTPAGCIDSGVNDGVDTGEDAGIDAHDVDDLENTGWQRTNASSPVFYRGTVLSQFNAWYFSSMRIRSAIGTARSSPRELVTVVALKMAL